jgi:hypothetical protein
VGDFGKKAAAACAVAAVAAAAFAGAIGNQDASLPVEPLPQLHARIEQINFKVDGLIWRLSR